MYILGARMYILGLQDKILNREEGTLFEELNNCKVCKNIIIIILDVEVLNKNNVIIT